VAAQIQDGSNIWPADRPGPVFVVGRAGMDLYPIPVGSKIKKAHQFQADLGGSAGNIAVALARRGVPVQLLSAVSADPAGDFVRAQLHAYGVGCDYLAQAGGLARSSLALAETRAEECEVVIYRNAAADLQIEAAHLAGIDFAAARALVITGTALSSDPSASSCIAAAEEAAGKGCPVVLDLDYRKEAWSNSQRAAQALGAFCDLCQIITGNDQEFAVLANADAQAVAAGRALAAELARKGRVILYKMGRQGCHVLTGDAVYPIGIWPVAMAKPFGAGDAFLGNLLAALASGSSWQAAAREGAAAAALVVSRPGCASAMPDGQQLADFMHRHDYQAATGES
jgi:5-dehydro-2-deoxygluconokinase